MCVSSCIILQSTKRCNNESHTIFTDLQPHKTQTPTSSGTCSTATSQIHMAAMFVITDDRKLRNTKQRVLSRGMNIHQWGQKLLVGQTNGDKTIMRQKHVLINLLGGCKCMVMAGLLDSWQSPQILLHGTWSRSSEFEALGDC